MTSGHFYKHEDNTDIFLDVLKMYPIKSGEWLVKARIYSVWYNIYYETVKFRLKAEDRFRWKLYTPAVT